MSPDRLDQALQSAIAAGVLPPGATRPEALDERPWPVVLLTALGAWLAAVPLFGAMWALLGELMKHGPSVYVAGLVVLGAAVAGLRGRRLPLFVEQLAVPALLVGVGLLGNGWLRDLPQRPGLALLAALVAGLAALVRAPWLRVLLGAGAAVCTVLACLPPFGQGPGPVPYGWAWQFSLAMWLGAQALQHRVLSHGARARHAAVLEPVSAGWLLATLAGLAWWSGMSFLVGASLGGGVAGAVAHDLSRWGGHGWGLTTLSVGLAAAAAYRLADRWPSLRQPWGAGLALVALGLSGFLPALGAVLLALALCVTTDRWRLAGAAAVAAAWIIGSFYYALQWPLATKALVLAGAGAVLGGLAGRIARTLPAVARAEPARPRASAGPLLTALAVLVVVNVGIWQKQALIANGQPVYVALAPVDPRSLMQGDYMQLAVRLPDDLQDGPATWPGPGRPRLVARRDARGVATLLRLDSGGVLAADELRIELTPKGGRWMLVSDAWFFKEGEAQRWAPARYAEFRVAPDGRALLVGLRGADLQAL